MGEQQGPTSPPRRLFWLLLSALLGLIAAYASGTLPFVQNLECKEAGGEWIDGLGKQQQLPRCQFPAGRESND
jgi:hypothetical protein